MSSEDASRGYLGVAHWAAGLILGLTLVGCAAGPSAPERPRAPVTTPGPGATAPHSSDGRTPAPATDERRAPAVVALVEQADERLAGGEPERAAAVLERALRIDPRDPALWHRLARVRLGQGRAAQAAQLAARSNALAGRDLQLQAANWRLIARARAAQGDAAGAGEARAMAERLARQAQGDGR